MSIGQSDIYLISAFLILRFGLVWFGWLNQNRKLNQTMRLSKKLIRIHPNKMRFQFGLVRFAVFLMDWFGFEHH
jgi:hypothetical protein